MPTVVATRLITPAPLPPLLQMYPHHTTTITPFSPLTNLLTSLTPLYLPIFIPLPLTTKYYTLIINIK
ncbi:DUF3100 domain-containing protein, partial [Staphylococcus saprophyticus]|uniref:DUF3100 domain-containing protein n=1 Tax=Staphylococcus saprophyticus TaxID=29385 RepID=UPI0028CBAAB8